MHRRPLRPVNERLLAPDGGAAQAPAARPGHDRPGTVIFDLDGTLIDSAQTIHGIINDMRTARRHGVVEHTMISPHLSKGGESLVALCLGEAALDRKDDLLDFRARYLTARQGPEILFEEVVSTLEILQGEGWALGICTNKPRLLVDNALAETGLERFFDAVVAGDDGFPPKPHPSSLLECCRRLDAHPAQAWYVGDSEVDQQTAATAQCPFLFVEHGYPVDDSSLIECHARLSDFRDLLAILSVRAI